MDNVQSTETTTKQTLHGALVLRHQRHVYKRGANKGDAPMEKRGKTHFRIINPETTEGCIKVRLYNTNIVTAYPDGRITLNMGGWDTHSTVKGINHILAHNPGARLCLVSKTFKGKSQMVVVTRHGDCRYYDGITFDGDGKLLSEKKPMLGRRVNKEKSQAFQAAMKESGFKALFPLLWAEAEPTEKRFYGPPEMRTILSSAAGAELWASIVSGFKWYWGWGLRGGTWGKEWSDDPKEKVWAKMMAHCRSDMYETYNVGEE